MAKFARSLSFERSLSVFVSFSIVGFSSLSREFLNGRVIEGRVGPKGSAILLCFGDDALKVQRNLAPVSPVQGWDSAPPQSKSCNAEQFGREHYSRRSIAKSPTVTASLRTTQYNQRLPLFLPSNLRGADSSEAPAPSCGFRFFGVQNQRLPPPTSILILA